MYSKYLQVVLLSVLVLLSSCATIVSDSSYPVQIISTPPGANFVIRSPSGKTVGHGLTPSTVKLKAGKGYFRRANYTLQFDKTGYSTSQQTMNATLDNWFWGNIPFGGALGLLIIDPATGAMWKLPEAVYGELQIPNVSTTANAATDSQALPPRETQSETEIVTHLIKNPENHEKIQKLHLLHANGEISDQEFNDLMKELNGL